MPATQQTIYTIGHSTRSLEELLSLLQSFAVTRLVDVRHFPGSRKFPHFNKEALMQTLPAAGVKYVHAEALGGRRKAAANSPNTAWRHPAFKGYADYMETPAFKQGIAQLEALARQASTAYMCSEAVWWRCHRAMISDFLKVQGWNVQHIMELAKAKEHPFPRLPKWWMESCCTALPDHSKKMFQNPSKARRFTFTPMALFNLTDSLNFLRKLTLRRLVNMAKVYSSYHISKWTGRPLQWGLPISISFEPTTSCNLRCPECPSGLRAFTRPTGMLRKDFFTETIDQLAPDLSYLIFYFQGEPFLNPQFLDMVKYAGSKNIYTATSTNAHYLTDAVAKRTVESGLDRLIISIDGTTQETYQQYRVGGKLDKVLEGARNIVKWKKELKSKTPFIVFQFLVVRHNEHQIEDVKQLAKEIGVDAVGLKTAQVYNYQSDPNGLIPTIGKYSRYKKDKTGVMQFKGNTAANHCWRLWHDPVITWDGAVVPCCFDKDAQHKLGHLQQQTFKELWRSGTYNGFRQSVLQSRQNIDICANCSEGVKVWGD